MQHLEGHGLKKVCRGSILENNSGLVERIQAARKSYIFGLMRDGSSALG
jgi:hypothetical protein